MYDKNDKSNDLGNSSNSLYYNRNEMRSAILNNKPIPGPLHVVVVMSNPLNFRKRLQLIIEFIKRMYLEKNISINVLELVYKGYNKSTIGSIPKYHKVNYMSLCVDTPLWHKENMINVAIEKMLPKNWKAVAWIDADIEFESPTWALDTLKILNGCRDIVQLFSHAVDMDQNKDAMNVFSSFGFMYEREREYSTVSVQRMFHPGYAWACTRDAYNKMNGLIQFGILGSGDQHMAMSFAKIADKSINSNINGEYRKKVLDFQYNIRNLRLGYIPGVIRHHYHGSKANRRYTKRWKILVDAGFNPETHIMMNEDSIIIPTSECPKVLLDGVVQYFKDRLEDD